MKIVITGALGHIGSRLVRDLPTLVPELEIVMVDNLSTQRFNSLFDMPIEGSYRFVLADVVTDDIDEWIDGAQFVVHLAAKTDAEASFASPEEVERVNLEGAIRVARICAVNDCVMIFPSTTSVYGPHGDEVDESCSQDELQPQSPYAESKLRAECALAQIPGLRYVICRLGTICGTSPGMRFHTAINKFCWQAVMGQALTVWRTAEFQRRPYLDLEDAVRAFAFLMTEVDSFGGDLVNVVTENSTVDDIVRAIAARVDDLQVEYVDSPIMNQLSYTVSSRRLSSRGFSFTGSIDRQIEATVQLLRQANLPDRTNLVAKVDG